MSPRYFHTIEMESNRLQRFLTNGNGRHSRSFWPNRVAEIVAIPRVLKRIISNGLPILRSSINDLQFSAALSARPKAQ